METFLTPRSIPEMYRPVEVGSLGKLFLRHARLEACGAFDFLTQRYPGIGDFRDHVPDLFLFQHCEYIAYSLCTHLGHVSVLGRATSASRFRDGIHNTRKGYEPKASCRCSGFVDDGCFGLQRSL